MRRSRRLSPASTWSSLEKFTPEAVAELVGCLPEPGKRARLGAAGGIDPSNAAAYVAAGADLIVTSWPYTARPRDVAVRLFAD